VLAHHQRAAEQVAFIQGMLADGNGNGIPDAFEPLVSQTRANDGVFVAHHAVMGPRVAVQVAQVHMSGAALPYRPPLPPTPAAVPAQRPAAARWILVCAIVAVGLSLLVLGAAVALVWAR